MTSTYAAIPAAVMLLVGAALQPSGGSIGRRTILDGDAGERLDRHLTQLADRGFAGVVLVARSANVLLHKGYGTADRQRATPIGVETVFDIGSITKQFTAAAILKLEVEGKLRTADPIERHLPDVPPDKRAITIHHLLTHSAGLAHGYGTDTEVAQRDATVRLILSKPLQSPPGKTYRYSNAGFSLLAAIVERVSAAPYERYLRDRFFDPLGMTQTGYRLPAWRPGSVAINYSNGKDNGPPLDRSWGKEGPYWHLFGNGGILSTAADMYEWDLALRQNRALPDAAVKRLFAPHMSYGPPYQHYPSENAYGYGWRLARAQDGARVFFHNGGSDFGVWAGHHHFPDTGVTVIVLSNALPVPENDDEGLPDRLRLLAAGDRVSFVGVM